MNKSLNLSKKSFAIYGLGKTGKSVINYFDRKGFENWGAWDDNAKEKDFWRKGFWWKGQHGRLMAVF